jgi:hypothetical protein
LERSLEIESKETGNTGRFFFFADPLAAATGVDVDDNGILLVEVVTMVQPAPFAHGNTKPLDDAMFVPRFPCCGGAILCATSALEDSLASSPES